MDVENKSELEKEAKKPAKPAKKSYLVPILIAVIVLLAASTAYFGWQYKQLKDDKKQIQSQVDNLNAQITKAIKNLANTATKPTATPTPTKAAVVTKFMIENTAAAISSKNTAALEGYMDTSVNVILAASEGMGPRTPAQAVSDLDYLSSGTDPWNFSLPAATLAKYASNQYYGKYFGSNTIVGESANKYVVSFGVNSNNGKIDTIFMAVSSDLL